jgi:hypothetical protein
MVSSDYIMAWTNSGDHSASYTGVLLVVFIEVKRLEHEANHSCASSARMKNEWSSLSLPLYLVSASTKSIKFWFSVLYNIERLDLVGLISLVIPVDVFVTCYRIND